MFIGFFPVYQPRIIVKNIKDTCTKHIQTLFKIHLICLCIKHFHEINHMPDLFRNVSLPVIGYQKSFSEILKYYLITLFNTLCKFLVIVIPVFSLYSRFIGLLFLFFQSYDVRIVIRIRDRSHMIKRFNHWIINIKLAIIRRLIEILQHLLYLLPRISFILRIKVKY